MNEIGVVINLILFYICVGCFLYNFNTFTFQEKVIMFTLYSGINSISYLCQSNLKV